MIVPTLPVAVKLDRVAQLPGRPRDEAVVVANQDDDGLIGP